MHRGNCRNFALAVSVVSVALGMNIAARASGLLRPYSEAFAPVFPGCCAYGLEINAFKTCIMNPKAYKFMKHQLRQETCLVWSLLVFFVLGMASCGESVNKGKADAGTPVRRSAAEVADWLGLGWNLGNQYDAFDNGVASDTAWGNPPVTKALFDSLAAAGFTSVRIPVTWLGHIGAAPDYVLDEAWLARVGQVVDYAEQAGLKVLVNIHHDGADSKHWLNIKAAAASDSANTVVKAQLRAVWSQIATYFKDKGEFLVLEAMNEIHDGGWGWGENRKDGGRQYAVLNEWNQVFVDAVRATGGGNATRYLGVPGYCTNPQLTLEHFVMPKDSVPGRLLVAVHFYDPVDFVLNDKYSQWGHTAAGGQYVPGGNEENVQQVFGSLKAKFIDQGIPVYIGEMGCVRRADERSEAFRKYYLEYVCKAARDNSLSLFYWDNGYAGTGREQSGLFDRATGACLNDSRDIVGAMVRGFFNDAPDYTLQSVYDNAPRWTVTVKDV